MITGKQRCRKLALMKINGELMRVCERLSDTWKTNVDFARPMCEQMFYRVQRDVSILPMCARLILISSRSFHLIKKKSLFHIDTLLFL